MFDEQRAVYLKWMLARARCGMLARARCEMLDASNSSMPTSYERRFVLAGLYENLNCIPQ